MRSYDEPSSLLELHVKRFMAGSVISWSLLINMDGDCGKMLGTCCTFYTLSVNMECNGVYNSTFRSFSFLSCFISVSMWVSFVKVKSLLTSLFLHLSINCSDCMYDSSTCGIFILTGWQRSVSLHFCLFFIILRSNNSSVSCSYSSFIWSFWLASSLV